MRLDIPLSTHEEDELDGFLAQVVDGAIPNFSALDGFLAAIVCSPGIIMPSEYMPVIQEGGTEEGDLTFENSGQARRFFELVFRYYNTLNTEFGDIGEFENDHRKRYTPCLTEYEDGQLYAGDWAKGFLVGTFLRHEAWNKYYNMDNSALEPILLLAYENHPDPRIRPFDEPFSNEMRHTIVDMATLAVHIIYSDFQQTKNTGSIDNPAVVSGFPPKTGRNKPCPCGSGKKYKKCCI